MVWPMAALLEWLSSAVSVDAHCPRVQLPSPERKLKGKIDARLARRPYPRPRGRILLDASEMLKQVRPVPPLQAVNRVDDKYCVKSGKATLARRATHRKAIEIEQRGHLSIPKTPRSDFQAVRDSAGKILSLPNHQSDI